MPFQPKLVAVYGLLPETLAFQLLVIRSLPEYCQLMFQPLTAVVPLLVIRIAPVKPVLHSLETRYWQTANDFAEMSKNGVSKRVVLKKRPALRHHEPLRVVGDFALSI